MKLTIGYSFLELLELTMRIDYRLIGEIVALAKSFRRIGNLRYSIILHYYRFSNISFNMQSRKISTQSYWFSTKISLQISSLAGSMFSRPLSYSYSSCNRSYKRRVAWRREHFHFLLSTARDFLFYPFL